MIKVNTKGEAASPPLVREAQKLRMSAKNVLPRELVAHGALFVQAARTPLPLWCHPRLCHIIFIFQSPTYLLNARPQRMLKMSPIFLGLSVQSRHFPSADSANETSNLLAFVPVSATFPAAGAATESPFEPFSS